MGGKGSGGARVGAGRKPLSDHERSLGGNAGHRSSSVSVGPWPTAPLETFEPPAGLPKAVLTVWRELAPSAFEARTLTRSTVPAFVMLCRNVVTERRLGKKLDTAGGPNHRGMIQRVEAEMARFCLSPFGKAVYKPQAGET